MKKCKVLPGPWQNQVHGRICCMLLGGGDHVKIAKNAEKWMRNLWMEWQTSRPTIGPTLSKQHWLCAWWCAGAVMKNWTKKCLKANASPTNQITEQLTDRYCWVSDCLHGLKTSCESTRSLTVENNEQSWMWWKMVYTKKRRISQNFIISFLRMFSPVVLFRQLLPSPVYATVCYLLDLLSWCRSSSGVSTWCQISEVVSVA